MIGRRRFTRYVLLAPADGHARTVTDCVVESWDGTSALVVTNHPARRGDELVMQLETPARKPALYALRVLSCEIDPRHGPPRFRLQVSVTPEESPDERSGAAGLPTHSHQDPPTR